MVRVTAAVLEVDGRVLIARRPAGERRGGLWEFPGGTLEPGEDPRDCLRRELREELGIEVEVGELLVRHVQAYEDVTIELSSYRARLVAGTPQAREHDALAWAAPDELPDYEFPAADGPTVELLCRAGREGAR
ncbi:MAG: (deoxy)nucleoside triphosphate pyrophosphohydrolase [Deltaproteobacteria bacterium]|nr:(deoxy)nucleoside triphosphate pyrophosphohydrolase [Deltaproteobacteria bacterium]